MKTPRSVLLLLALAACVGCSGGDSPFKSVPVTGKVLYDDGTPIPVAGMKVYFHSQQPPIDGKHPRPATVDVGADGTFENVTTYKFADGLVLGKHKVTLVAMENGKLSPKIPADCSKPATSPLVIEVTKSGQQLEITVPKP